MKALGSVAGLNISSLFTLQNYDVLVREDAESNLDTVTDTLDIHTFVALIKYFDSDHVSSGSYSRTHLFGYTSARFDGGYRSHPELIEDLEPHIMHGTFILLN